MRRVTGSAFRNSRQTSASEGRADLIFGSLCLADSADYLFSQLLLLFPDLYTGITS